MMHFNKYFSLVLLAIMVCSNAYSQNNLEQFGVDLSEFPDLNYPASFNASPRNGIIEKLDSTIGTTINDIPIITRKRIYQYDEFARDTLETYYLLDNNTSTLYEQTIVRTAFDDNTSVETSFRTFNASNPIQPSARTTSTVENDLTTLREIENWDDVTATFIPRSRRALVLDSANITQYENYLWDEVTEEYTLSSVNVVEQQEFSFLSTSYNIENEELVPSNRTLYETNPANNLLSKIQSERYSADSSAFYASFVISTEFDIVNFSGSQTAYSRFNITDDLVFRDSFQFIYNTDWFIIDQESYGLDANDIIQFEAKFEIDRNENNNRTQLRSFSLQGDQLVLSSTTDFYYSEVDVVTSAINIEPELSVNLQFANPASSDGIIFVDGKGINQPLDLWITDLKGRRVGNQKITSSQSINLSDYHLSTGLYFLTVLEKGNQKTWKIVIE